MSESSDKMPSNSFLEEVLNILRREMATMRRELIADFRAEMAELRAEWRGELSSDVKQQDQNLDKEISEIKDLIESRVADSKPISEETSRRKTELQSVIQKSTDDTDDRISSMRAEFKRDIVDLRSQTETYGNSRLSSEYGVMQTPHVSEKNILSEQVMLDTSMFPRFDQRDDVFVKKQKSSKKRKKKKHKRFKASRLIGQPDGSDPSDSSSSSDESESASTEDSEDSDEDSTSEMGDRRNSLANRVRFRSSKKVQSKNYEVIMTQAKPVCNSKLSFVNAKNAFKFCMELDIFEQKENVKLTWSAYVEESAARQIQRKNKRMIPTLPSFYRLTNKQVFKAIQRTCRPSGVDEFLKVLEDSVEFVMPNGKEASFSNYNYLYSQLYIFFDVFREMFEFLLDGCKFQKELSYDDKPGSIVRIFIDKVSKETDYLQKLMKGSKTKSFDDLDMFYRFLRKKVEEHKYFTMHNSIISRTFFSAKKSNSDMVDSKKKFFQKRLTHIDVNNIQEDDSEPITEFCAYCS